MNVLLVDILGTGRQPTISLQKIASYHLLKRNVVRYINNYDYEQLRYGLLDSFNPDIIYITTIFTFDLKKIVKIINKLRYLYKGAEIKVGGISATLMPEYIERKTGIIPIIGLWKEIDVVEYEFNFFPKIDYLPIFTSRGCLRKCSFCMSSKIEPKFYILDNWKGIIEQAKKKKVYIQDNNFLVAPIKHIKDVVEYLVEGEYKVDFNQGLDARLFTKEIAVLFKDIDFICARFAFDDLSEDRYVQKAIRLFKKYNRSWDLMVYCLYNYKDTPEDLYYRAKEVVKLGAGVYFMKYSSFTLDKGYIGKNWTKEKIFNFKEIIKGCFRFHGIYCRFKIEDFNDLFGKNEKEFVDKLEGR